MSERRTRLQIHLSTALILTLATGVLMALNLVPELAHANYRAVGTQALLMHEDPLYGWPLKANGYAHEMQLPLQPGKPILVETHLAWSYLSIAIDVIVAVLVLIPVWYLCERRLRRNRR